MITIKVPIQIQDEDKEFIKTFQQKQSSLIRSAYKQASLGLAEISIRNETPFKKSSLDSWFIRSAIKSGIGMFVGDYKTNQSKRVFGGKQNFIKRCKGLISNQQWKEKRLLPLYIIGECNYKGNRKFNFEQDSVIFKPYKGKTIEIQLPKLNSNWSKLWNEAVMLAKNKLIPITVSLTPEYICLTFEDKIVKKSLKFKPKPIKNRYAGIDLNPNYIGISIFDNNKLIETKLFDLSELTGKNKNENKIKHETREIANFIGKWLTHLRVDKVFIEELKFNQGSLNKGKNLNRLCKNQWKRSDFTSVLEKYFKLYSINAAYTSTIGNVLEPNHPDPIAASMAIAKRGYELVIKKSKKFYPELPSKQELEDRWKKTEFPDFSSWKELHDFIKNSGLRYRVPIPEKEGFRVFQSRLSLVGIL